MHLLMNWAYNLSKNHAQYNIFTHGTWWHSLEQLATAQPSMQDLSVGPPNQILRFANSTMIWLLLWLLQVRVLHNDFGGCNVYIAPCILLRVTGR